MNVKTDAVGALLIGGAYGLMGAATTVAIGVALDATLGFRDAKEIKKGRITEQTLIFALVGGALGLVKAATSLVPEKLHP